MYHSISDDRENDVAPYYRVNTSLAAYRSQMQYLSNRGYKTVTISEAVSLLARKSEKACSSLSSVKLVSLTFDDGFEDFYTHAFPILREFGFTATVFLPTAFICRDLSSSLIQHSAEAPFSSLHSVPPIFRTKRFLNWEQIRELHRYGIQFGSHTVNHPQLVDLGWPEIQAELRDSKVKLEEELGEQVTTFCYPFAFPQADKVFVNKFRDNLQQAGYECCTTTKVGRARMGGDPFRVKRLPVNSFDDDALFAAKLEGAYDWLGAPQAAVKACKQKLAARRRVKNPPASVSVPASAN